MLDTVKDVTIIPMFQLVRKTLLSFNSDIIYLKISYFIKCKHVS